MTIECSKCSKIGSVKRKKKKRRLNQSRVYKWKQLNHLIILFLHYTVLPTPSILCSNNSNLDWDTGLVWRLLPHPPRRAHGVATYSSCFCRIVCYLFLLSANIVKISTQLLAVIASASNIKTLFAIPRSKGCETFLH